MSSPSRPGSWGVPATWILVFLVAVRVALAVVLGPGRDEAAYWYQAWHEPDASYSGATILAIRSATSALGDSSPAMRIPFLLAGIAACLLTATTVRHLGGSRPAAQLAAVTVASIPTLAFSGSVVHPDAMLVLGVTGFAERAAARTRHGPGRGRLTTAAVWAAVAAFSKLTGALMLVPAATLVWERRGDGRDAFLAAFVTGAAGVTLLLAADTQLLRSVLELGTFARDLPPALAPLWLTGEILLWAGPASLFLAGAGAIAAARDRLPGTRHAALGAALLLVFFIAFALSGRAKANWFVPSLVLLLPAGVCAMAARERLRTTAWLAAAAVLITLGQSTALVLPRAPALWEAVTRSAPGSRLDGTYVIHVGPREAAVSPTRSWKERAEEFLPRTVDPRVRGASRLAGRDYGLTFRLALALGRDTHVHLPWDPIFARRCAADPPPGKTVLFVSRDDPPPTTWTERFADVVELAPDPGGDPDLRVWRCSEATGARREPSATEGSRLDFR